MADSILGRFVWHELMAPDTKTAGRFFSRVIGWKLKPWAEDGSYVMFMAGKRGMGGLMAASGGAKAPPMWLTYIATPDLAATVKKAKSLRGQVLKEITAIPTIGRFAVIQDPQGAVFVAFTPDGGPSGPAAPPGELDFSWHELATTNVPKALAFYRALFGWQPTDSMDMGPMGIYQMYGLGGGSMGGIYPKPKEMPGPPAWLAYIRVADVKRTAQAIKKAGGTVINGPMQVPGGDWIAQALDTQGGMFAIHSAGPKAAPASRARKSAKTAKSTRTRTAAKKPARPAQKAVAKSAKKTAARKGAARKAAPRASRTASRSRAARRTRR